MGKNTPQPEPALTCTAATQTIYSEMSRLSDSNVRLHNAIGLLNEQMDRILYPTETSDSAEKRAYHPIHLIGRIEQEADSVDEAIEKIESISRRLLLG